MRVLVLCHGNINRSAFCAALIRAARPSWTVISAGLKTKDGRPATPKAKRGAAERGLSLDDHRSRVLTWDKIVWADIVLYMDGGNEKRLHAFIKEQAPSMAADAKALMKCQLLAKYGCLRRLGDPNYTSDPDILAEMWAAQELCVRQFLEKHP